MVEIHVFQASSAVPSQPNLNVPESNLSNIEKYAIFLKENGRAEATVQTAIERLKRLKQIANLHEPDQIKTALANLKWKNSTKRTVTKIYSQYLKYLGGKWDEPNYKADHEIYFIPTEEELNTLILSARPKMAAFLQLLKETGARSGEAANLQWIDIDTQRKTVHIKPEKGSNPRLLPISDKLINMLNKLPRKNNQVFQSTKHGLRTTFESIRKRTAEKLSNPRILEIHLHTFRHWKGTTEYHKTKDIIHVKYVLGHKKIETTMIYINIEQALFLAEADEWTTTITHSIKEETKAINTGFELVRAINETTAIYKKRK